MTLLEYQRPSPARRRNAIRIVLITLAGVTASVFACTGAMFSLLAFDSWQVNKNFEEYERLDQSRTLAEFRTLASEYRIVRIGSMEQPDGSIVDTYQVRYGSEVFMEIEVEQQTGKINRTRPKFSF